MILVDTSVWVDHFHQSDFQLEQLLRIRKVLSHPFVMGEVALGALPNRGEILRGMDALRPARMARDEEVMQLIEEWALTGTGIGYMDAHLLASVLLTSGSRLWTRDRALRKVAQQLAVDAGLK